MGFDMFEGTESCPAAVEGPSDDRGEAAPEEMSDWIDDAPTTVDGADGASDAELPEGEAHFDEERSPESEPELWDEGGITETRVVPAVFPEGPESGPEEAASLVDPRRLGVLGAGVAGLFLFGWLSSRSAPAATGAERSHPRFPALSMPGDAPLTSDQIAQLLQSRAKRALPQPEPEPAEDVEKGRHVLAPGEMASVDDHTGEVDIVPSDAPPRASTPIFLTRPGASERPHVARRARSAPWFYEVGKVEGADGLGAPEPAPALPLEVADVLEVELLSGLSSLSRDRVVLARLARAFTKSGKVILRKGTVVRGRVENHGEQRFFLSFGEVLLDPDTPHTFRGRAQQRGFSGIVARRREATLEERQQFTLTGSVLSGLATAARVATSGLGAPAVQAVGQAADGTAANVTQEAAPERGFVLEAAEGRAFEVLVTG